MPTSNEELEREIADLLGKVQGFEKNGEEHLAEPVRNVLAHKQRQLRERLDRKNAAG